MSDGRSSFSHSIPFLYRDSVSGYIKQFFLTIGKYFKKNPKYYTCKIFFLFPKMLIVHPTYFPVLMLCCWDKFSLSNVVFYSAYQLSC